MRNPKQLTALRSPHTAPVALALALLTDAAARTTFTLPCQSLPLASQGLTPPTDLRATPFWH